MNLQIVWNEDKTAHRLYDMDTGKQYGELFQGEAVRSDEWKSALIVYEKYRRKYDWEFDKLTTLKKYIVDWSNDRQDSGKKVNKDILVQECSRYVKEKFINPTT